MVTVENHGRREALKEKLLPPVATIVGRWRADEPLSEEAAKISYDFYMGTRELIHNIRSVFNPVNYGLSVLGTRGLVKVIGIENYNGLADKYEAVNRHIQGLATDFSGYTPEKADNLEQFKKVVDGRKARCLVEAVQGYVSAEPTGGETISLKGLKADIEECCAICESMRGGSKELEIDVMREVVEGIVNPFIEPMENGFKSAAGLVDNFCRRVSEGRIPMRPVSVNNMLKSLKSTSMKVVLRLEDGVPEVMGNESALIGDVFSPILRNAEYATCGMEAPELTITTRTHGGMAVIEFEDNGTGIPPELWERVFEPGFSTKSAVQNGGRIAQGQGLGLLAARREVKEHGGTITANDPRPGNTGAHFVITLPPMEK